MDREDEQVNIADNYERRLINYERKQSIILAALAKIADALGEDAIFDRVDRPSQAHQ